VPNGSDFAPTIKNIYVYGAVTAFAGACFVFARNIKRDLNLIKRKLEEYERRILRLKELERELNSLNTEGLESEANAIRSKLKDPRKVEEVEKAIVALKK